MTGHVRVPYLQAEATPPFYTIAYSTILTVAYFYTGYAAIKDFVSDNLLHWAIGAVVLLYVVQSLQHLHKKYWQADEATADYGAKQIFFSNVVYRVFFGGFSLFLWAKLEEAFWVNISVGALYLLVLFQQGVIIDYNWTVEKGQSFTSADSIQLQTTGDPRVYDQDGADEGVAGGSVL